jgi:hypothetical protein
VTITVQILYLTVIGPFVGNVECSGDWASVWIDATTLEQVAVQLLVKVVNRIIESQQDNLWGVVNGHIAYRLQSHEQDEMN